MHIHYLIITQVLSLNLAISKSYAITLTSLTITSPHNEGSHFPGVQGVYSTITECSLSCFELEECNSFVFYEDDYGDGVCEWLSVVFVKRDMLSPQPGAKQYISLSTDAGKISTFLLHVFHYTLWRMYFTILYGDM